jgi:hypothetical protein
LSSFVLSRSRSYGATGLDVHPPGRDVDDTWRELGAVELGAEDLGAVVVGGGTVVVGGGVATASMITADAPVPPDVSAAVTVTV